MQCLEIGRKVGDGVFEHYVSAHSAELWKYSEEKK